MFKRRPKLGTCTIRYIINSIPVMRYGKTFKLLIYVHHFVILSHADSNFRTLAAGSPMKYHMKYQCQTNRYKRLFASLFVITEKSGLVHAWTYNIESTTHSKFDGKNIGRRKWPWGIHWPVSTTPCVKLLKHNQWAEKQLSSRLSEKKIENTIQAYRPVNETNTVCSRGHRRRQQRVMKVPEACY